MSIGVMIGLGKGRAGGELGCWGERVLKVLQANYERLLSEVRRLDADERLKLLEDLVVLIRAQSGLTSKHSILELQGLGKEIWEGVDPRGYVNQERNAWNG